MPTSGGQTLLIVERSLCKKHGTTNSHVGVNTLSSSVCMHTRRGMLDWLPLQMRRAQKGRALRTARARLKGGNSAPKDRHEPASRRVESAVHQGTACTICDIVQDTTETRNPLYHINLTTA